MTGPTTASVPPLPPLAASLAQEALLQVAEGVIVADVAGRIIFVNDAAARFHGVARLDVPPESYADSYHLFTEDGQPYPSTDLPLARAVLKGETVVEARWRIRRPDGTEILAVGSARPIVGTEGRQIGAVLTLRDDEARAEAQTAVRERDVLAGQLREAFEQSPVSTVVYDTTGRPVAANSAFERLWGAGLADVPAGYTVLTDPQLDAAGVLPLLRRAFGMGGGESAGEPVTLPALRYDVASTTGRGRTLWTQAYAYPVRDANGAVERVVLSHEDVTARMEAEGKLREALGSVEARERRVRAVLESISDAFYALDRDWKFTYVNARAEQILGTLRRRASRTFHLGGVRSGPRHRLRARVQPRDEHRRRGNLRVDLRAAEPMVRDSGVSRRRRPVGLLPRHHGPAGFRGCVA